MNVVKLIMIACLGFFLSCDLSDGDLTDIDNLPVSAEVDLDYLPLNLLGFYTPPIDLNVKAELEKKIGVDGTIDNVDEIILDKLVLELVSCDDQDNFDFLDKVELWVKTPDNEKKLVAKLDSVPNGKQKVELNSLKDPLDDYIKNEDMQVIVRYFSNEDARNLVVKLNMEFDADLDL